MYILVSLWLALFSSSGQKVSIWKSNIKWWSGNHTLCRYSSNSELTSNVFANTKNWLISVELIMLPAQSVPQRSAVQYDGRLTLFWVLWSWNLRYSSFSFPSAIRPHAESKHQYKGSFNKAELNKLWWADQQVLIKSYAHGNQTTALFQTFWTDW